MGKPPHTFFSARKKKLSCTLYTSGKLTVQGKEKEEFITYYLEPEILKLPIYTYPEIEVDLSPHIGVDEAGKGDFFGPLCIAGVQADEAGIRQLLSMGVRDSKKMSDKTIFQLAHKIRTAFPYSIVRIFPLKYNALYETFHNLNHLLAWGHATVIAELAKKTGCEAVLIDQFSREPLVEKALKKIMTTPISLKQRPRAEEDPVVAAASILARTAFVEGIERLGREFNQELPKGASNKVIMIGRELVEKYGKVVLSKVAKLHFKTYQDILSNNNI